MSRLVICADVDGVSGYSIHLQQIVSNLVARGVEVAIRPNKYETIFGVSIPPILRDRVVTEVQPEKWEMVLRHPFLGYPNNKRTVFNTMYESDAPHRDIINTINQAEVVVVPCVWNKVAFKKRGVFKPIHVVHLGIDPTVFVPRSPAERSEMVFGAGGWLAHGADRKGLLEVMAAFKTAFPKEKDVRLRIKTLPARKFVFPDDPRIDVTPVFLSPASLADWYHAIDCFVSGAKSEAWGLMQHEAMACGKPLISTVYSGVAEFFNASAGWELPYKLVDAGGMYKGQGKWAEPSPRAMIEAMRDAYHNRGQLATKGVEAAKLAHRFTWEASCSKLLDVLCLYGVIG